MTPYVRVNAVKPSNLRINLTSGIKKVGKVIKVILGSLSTRVFETQTATGRGHFSCKDSGVSQIFIRIISNGEKILSTVNVVV